MATGSSGNMDTANKPSLASATLIKQFTGKPDCSIELFFEELENFAAINDWPKGKMLVTIAQNRCTQDAEAYLKNNADIRRIEDYEEFKKAMRRKFMPKLTYNKLDEELSACIQGQNESISDYAGRIRTIRRKYSELIGKVDVGVDGIILTKFLLNMKAEYKQFVKRRDPKTLEQAIEFAEFEESIAEKEPVKASVTSIRSQGSTAAVIVRGEYNRNRNERDSPATRNFQRNGQTWGPKTNTWGTRSNTMERTREVRCYKCGQLNHFAAHCMVESNRRQGQEQTTGRYIGREERRNNQQSAYENTTTRGTNRGNNFKDGRYATGIKNNGNNFRRPASNTFQQRRWNNGSQQRRGQNNNLN